MQCKKQILKVFIAYVVMVGVFLGLNVLVSMIPHRLTDDNIRTSLQIISEEGRFPTLAGNPLWAKENVTDGTMYNMLVSDYGLSPLQEALTTPRTLDHEIDSVNPADFGLMALATQDGTVARRGYGRYWHGWQVPLRVLSMGLTIKGIRILNYVLLSLLLLGSAWLIRWRFGVRTAAGWLVAMFLAGFVAVPVSMQYVACFYIAMVAVAAACLRLSLARSVLFYFIIGGLTSYFDLITAPLITLCLPLAVAILCKPELRGRQFLALSGAWGAGYLGIWATKLLLMSLFSANNGFSEAAGAGVHYTIIPFLPEGVHHKYFVVTCLMLGAALVATVAIFALKKPHTSRRKMLFAVALIPFVWYVLFLGHNVIHLFFTYRNLLATFFCCWLILFPTQYFPYSCVNNKNRS